MLFRLSLFLLSVRLLSGCFSTPKPKRYTVFTPEVTASQTPKHLPFSKLRVRMAKDLRAYNTPLRFKADGTVEPYRGLTYYAPLELALERALQDMTSLDKTNPRALSVEVRRYCVIDGATAAAVAVCLQVQVSGQPEQTLELMEPIALDASPDAVRHAFARVLQQIWTAYTP
jgi:hypothetical protein